MALGRSFGVAPANRGIVVRGPYSFVRHPIYTGYLITHTGFRKTILELASLYERLADRIEKYERLPRPDNG